MTQYSLQAGAQKVIAVEASNMAKYAQMLADANPGDCMPCVTVLLWSMQGQHNQGI